jgi:ribosomal silencing factor RsfS
VDNLVDFITELIFQKHGIDVVVMDFTEEENAFTDYFILCMISVIILK